MTSAPTGAFLLYPETLHQGRATNQKRNQDTTPIAGQFAPEDLLDAALVIFSSLRVDPGLGLEPRLTASEAAVLPLDDPGMKRGPPEGEPPVI